MYIYFKDIHLNWGAIACPFATAHDDDDGNDDDDDDNVFVPRNLSPIHHQ